MKQSEEQLNQLSGNTRVGIGLGMLAFLSGMLIVAIIVACAQKLTGVSKSGSTHGTQQLQNMLANRLQMNVCWTPQGPRYVSLDDPFCQWAIEQFNGHAPNVRVFWDSRPPSNGEDSTHSVSYRGEVVTVAVRDLTENGSPNEAFERMWRGLTYQLFYLQDRPKLLDLFNQAKSGQLNRTQFVREAARLDFNALCKLDEFWRKKWKPWSIVCGFPTQKAEWVQTRSLPFDEWFATQLTYEKKTGYPSGSHGLTYDWLQEIRSEKNARKNE